MLQRLGFFLPPTIVIIYSSDDHAPLLFKYGFRACGPDGGTTAAWTRDGQQTAKVAMPSSCCNAFAPPRMAPCPSMGPNTKTTAPQRQDRTVGYGYRCVLVFATSGAAFGLVSARPGFSFQRVTLPAVTLAGLNRHFYLHGGFPKRFPSRVPNSQGTHFRVPSWWCIALALRQLLWFALAVSWRLVSTPASVPVRASSQRHVDFALALPRQRLGFAPALW